MGQKIVVLGNNGVKAEALEQPVLWQSYQAKVARVDFARDYFKELNVNLFNWVVEMSAAIKPGDSGGPVVDEEGRLAAMSFAESKRPGHGFAVDVEQIHGLLRGLPQSRPQTQALVGSWTMQAPVKDRPDIIFKIRFHKDGTCALGHDKTFAGKYSFVKDALHLEIPGVNMRERVVLQWEDGDHCSFVSEGKKVTLTRI